jgi:hypothetical protein
MHCIVRLPISHSASLKERKGSRIPDGTAIGTSYGSAARRLKLDSSERNQDSPPSREQGPDSNVLGEDIGKSLCHFCQYVFNYWYEITPTKSSQKTFNFY